MKFGIACSRYNAVYTDGLLEAAVAELAPHPVAIVRVPGAFEVPLALQRLAQAGGFDALIALGVIWQGKTDHARLIATECARACMDLALRFNCPVIFEILTVRTEAEARARCLGRKINRGSEAARTALEMATLTIPKAAPAGAPAPKAARRRPVARTA